MIARQPEAAVDAGSIHARAVLAIAAEVEAAEVRIKQAILAAARAGDTARIIDLVTRWQTLPSSEVLASKLSGNAVDSMRGSEVQKP